MVTRRYLTKSSKKIPAPIKFLAVSRLTAKNIFLYPDADIGISHRTIYDDLFSESS